MSIHDFSVKDIHGKEVRLSDFKGKTLLIVNTATKCSLTPQYDDLEELYQKYKDKGLVILDFPSNEFGQAVEDNAEITKFLKEEYQISFPIFAKININGESTHPLYAYLKEQKGEEVANSKYEILLEIIAQMNETRTGNDIKWNFTKFLVDKDGKVTQRFAPTVSTKEMESVIQEELANMA
ncbi:Glutathione peroxidase homolog BsaA [Moraxella caprae]|uniref:Glutathione peroxidase n=1 Tax=Moraxella caprae TaxID=90240 RepID=A0A378R0A2_9GAMM|nr:glutathione peroxidase [Moraxella caprae]STZ08229.1 Glutathione peroxidase homolog BsaA [Moraxella caprae]